MLCRQPYTVNHVSDTFQLSNSRMIYFRRRIRKFLPLHKLDRSRGEDQAREVNAHV